jgi:hypothetical protein
MRWLAFFLLALSMLCARALLAHADPIQNDMGLTVTAPIDPSAAANAAELERRISAIQSAAGDKTLTVMSWALLAAFVLKVIIDAINSWTDLSEKAKKVIPLVCTVLGALATVLAKFGGGMNLEHALIVGLVPLLSVVVNELHNAVKTPPKPPVAKEPDIKPAGGAPSAALVLLAVGLSLGSNGCAGGWAQFQADVAIVSTDIGKQLKCDPKILNDIVAGIVAGAGGIAQDVINLVEDGACIYIAEGAAAAKAGGVLAPAQARVAAKAHADFQVVKARRAAEKHVGSRAACCGGEATISGGWGAQYAADLSLARYPGIVVPLGAQ